MAEPRRICASEELVEKGSGVRFEMTQCGQPVPAFAVRFGGRVLAFVNRCAHVSVELDWIPGQFFDDSRLYLICATHGAVYEPDSGRCLAGPCRGASLVPVAIEERNGAIYLKASTP